MSRFGLLLLSARGFVDRELQGARARLFAGLAGHSFLKFSTPASGAIGLAIAAHVRGWPMPKGGGGPDYRGDGRFSEKFGRRNRHGRGDSPRRGYSIRESGADGCASQADSQTGGDGIGDFCPVIEAASKTFSLGREFSSWIMRFRLPVPWTATECARAATVRMGGTFEEIESAEEKHWQGQVAEKPFVLLTQPTLFDSTRAPQGRRLSGLIVTYPFGWTIEGHHRKSGSAVERFAPGFKQTILHPTKSFPVDLERQNRNLVGGRCSWRSANVAAFFRPALRMDPYRVPGDYPWWICLRELSAARERGCMGCVGFMRRSRC